MNIGFSNKVVLVTGGTGGLGRSVSLAFLDEEANVIVTYRKPDEFEILKREAKALASQLSGKAVDVTDESAVSKWIDEVVGRYGRVDALVNTVGGYVGGVKFWDSDLKTLEQMLALNLRSAFILSRAVGRVMREKSSGAIINVGAKAAFDHPGGTAAYAASKAALVAMMDSFAADLKGSGVRVNTILPSTIDTEANRKAMPTADFNKWPKPEDIAKVILFLCSDAARVIHGAAVPVYGNN